MSPHRPSAAVGVASGSCCRGCGQPLARTFVDLGYSPLANAYLRPTQLTAAEKSYPLRVFVCEKCLLVQLESFASPEELFGDYLYFSSFSDSWLAHAEKYVAQMIERFGLGSQSRVIEIASNDGYLLQYFVERGVPVLGIEPAAQIARVSEAKGIPTLVRFFGRRLGEELAAEGRSADLLIANNVLAHVPDVHDFVAGMARVLAPGGVLTLEFPSLLNLIEENQFDTIYHEHFSYFSFHSVEKILDAHDLVVWDVEQLPTHGGSLRVFGQLEGGAQPVTDRVHVLRAKENQAKLDNLEAYQSFWARVKRTKWKLLRFLLEAKERGQTIAAYGAPAKGNTLLNYCGIGRDFIEYTVDRSPYKQGLFLPGSHIPIEHPDKLRETRPDYLLILPWNLKDEIIEQTSYIRGWGGKWVVPIPEPAIHS